MRSAKLFSALTAAGLLLASTARADDRSEDIDDLDKGNYGNEYMMLTLNGAQAWGKLRDRDAGTEQGYSRRAGQIEFRGGGFFGQNYFRTLIGLEGAVAFGVLGKPSYDEPTFTRPPQTEGAAPVVGHKAYEDQSWYYLRGDFAFTYGLLRWNRVVPGRLVGGLGAGFEVAPRWPAADGSDGYGLLLLRLQLWPARGVGVHLTATTTIGSYRFEGLVGLAGWTVGGRLRLYDAARNDKNQETQVEVLLGRMF